MLELKVYAKLYDDGSFSIHIESGANGETKPIASINGNSLKDAVNDAEVNPPNVIPLQPNDNDLSA